MTRSPLLLVVLMVCTQVYGQLEAPQTNIYTIPNQSAHFIRMPSREASTEVDAVYFNPAGLTSMKYDGWNISINNQALRQKSTVTYTNSDSSTTMYPGVASSLVFPSIFASYKKDRYAIWMGFHVVAGAGGASYGDLPSVGNGLQSGIDLASFVLDRVNQNVFQNSGTDPGYGFNELQYDFSSEGFAFTPGILGGFSYKVNEVMSFGVGARYVINRLVATGYLRDVQVSDDGQTFMSPGDYLQNILDNEPNLSNSLRPLVSSYIQIMDTLLGDREIDVVQTAQGFTPVLSLNLTFNDRLNASIKYEHRTKMTYKINVREGKDGGMVYSEGNDSLRCNLPGFLQLGLSYKWTDRFRTNFGYRMLFDQGVDWNGREEYINKNYYEVGIGWEVLVGKKYKGSVSGGYTWNKPSVSGEYQNEVDYRLPGHTFCIGGTFVFSEFVKLNTGLMFTYFLPERVTEYKGSNGDVFDNSSYYEKNAIVFGIGLDMALGKARNESTPVIEE